MAFDRLGASRNLIPRGSKPASWFGRIVECTAFFNFDQSSCHERFKDAILKFPESVHSVDRRPRCEENPAQEASLIHANEPSGQSGV
jgi:hypothetical protein